jgi:CheY-like chemotaxis protein
VRTGQAALDYVRRQGAYADPSSSPRPELILLDLRLPLIDGLSVLREIKGDVALRDIPVVVLTTSDAPLDVQQAYEAHANSYLVKPMDHERFDALVRELGLYWAGWNRAPDRTPA